MQRVSTQFRKKMLKILTPSLWDIIKSPVEKRIRKTMKPQILLKSKIDSSRVFCIVHWNAPDFLLVTVKQIEKFYPNYKIYILDNGSGQKTLQNIEGELKKFDNITLFAWLGCPNWGKTFGLDVLFTWQTHTAGLQFLLNYSAKQPDEIAVFLDQDCILFSPIDELFSKFDEKTVLIGARDYLYVPDDYGPLKRGRLTRNCYRFIHPSFLILQPKRILQLFGNSSFYDKRADSLKYYAKKALLKYPEPYHGISFKNLGNILYIDTKMHEKIPFLTSYVYNDKIFAWHAWYSSQVHRAALKATSSLDGLPLSWLQEVRNASLEFMEQTYRNTTSDL